MPIIDFHNHYYPPAYLKALQNGESFLPLILFLILTGCPLWSAAAN